MTTKANRVVEGRSPEDMLALRIEDRLASLVNEPDRIAQLVSSIDAVCEKQSGCNGESRALTERDCATIEITAAGVTADLDALGAAIQGVRQGFHELTGALGLRKADAPAETLDSSSADREAEQEATTYP
jgi:hypothetical protein